MRRRLGFKLTTFGEKLMSFIGYLEHTGDTVLTTRAALAWATDTPRSTDEVHWSRRPRSRPMTPCRTTTGASPRTCSPPRNWPAYSRRRVP